MAGVTVEDMKQVAAELRDRLAQHDEICTRLHAAEVAHKRAYLQAHAASTSFHPDRKVKEHEVAAEEASFAAWETLNGLQYELRAAKEAMHSLRQVLSSFQTQARAEADLTRGAAA